MNRWAFQFFTPIILFSLLLIDSQLSQLFVMLSGGRFSPISHIFFIFLIYSVTKHRLPYLIIVSIFLGLIYDSYFIGVIGIAAALFPLITLFLHEIRRTVFTNRWTRLASLVIILFIFELAVPLIELLFGIIKNMNFIDFVSQQLAPTLILGIVFAIILQPLLESFYSIKKTEAGYIIN